MLFAIVFPGGKLEEFRQDHERNGDGYDTPLSSLLYNLPEDARSSIAEQPFVGEIANGGNCVWVNALGSTKSGVSLMGDSGHAQWPSLGQGCCGSMETAAVFCRTVSDLQKDAPVDSADWAADVVAEYNWRRYVDAHATVNLTYNGIGGKDSRGRGNAPLSFTLQVGVTMLWSLLTLNLVPRPAMLRLFMGENVPYSAIQRQMKMERWFLRAHVIGLAVGLVWYVSLLLAGEVTRKDVDA